MIKIIEESKPVTCDCCKARMSFEEEDVKTKLVSRGPCDYGGDCAGTEETWMDYIVCPSCGYIISLNYHTHYR